MSGTSRKSSWHSKGLSWTRETVLKPTFRALSRIEHPRVQQGLDVLEATYRKLTAREVRVQGPDPFVLVVAWGATPESLGQLADEVQLARTAFPGWEPIIVTDCDELAAIQTTDLKVEYIPPHQEWCAVNDPEEWPAYISEHLSRLRSTYEPTGVFVVSRPEDLGALRQGIVAVMLK